MPLELRPSTNEAFYERLRSAEARKLEEISNTIRRPRVADRGRAKCISQAMMVADVYFEFYAILGAK